MAFSFATQVLMSEMKLRGSNFLPSHKWLADASERYVPLAPRQMQAEWGRIRTMIGQPPKP